MTENLTWQEIHNIIRTMIQKMETQETVTRTISRINYSELLGVLSNFTIFQYQKDIQLKIDCQDEIIIIQMINKESET